MRRNVRLLRERDTSRSSADKLARAVLDHIGGDNPDTKLAGALVDYFNADGPEWYQEPATTRLDLSRP